MDLNGLLETVARSRAEPIALTGRNAPNLEFSLGEYALRYTAASGLMRELNLDALVLAQPNTIRYISGLQTWLWILPTLLPTAALVPLDQVAACLLAARVRG